MSSVDELDNLAALVAASLRFEQEELNSPSNKDKYKRIDFGMFSPDRFSSPPLLKKDRMKHSSTCFWNCFYAGIVFHIIQATVSESLVQGLLNLIEGYPFPADFKELSSSPVEGDHPISESEINNLALALDFRVEVIDSGDYSKVYNPNGLINIRTFLFNGHYTLIVNKYSDEEIAHGINVVAQFTSIVGKQI